MMYGRKFLVFNPKSCTSSIRYGFRPRRKLHTQIARRCNSSSTSKPVSSAFWLSRLANSLTNSSRIVAAANILWENVTASTSQRLQSILKSSKLVSHKKLVKAIQDQTKQKIHLSLHTTESPHVLQASKGKPIEESDPKSDKAVEEFIKEQENEVKEVIEELEKKQGLSQKPSTITEKKPFVSQVIPQVSLESRSKFLLTSLISATSPSSQLTRLEELNRHLLQYPESQCFLVKERAVSHLLRIRENTNDRNISSTARQSLALLGYSDPPKGRGINVLSIDGGGTRGILAIEVLKHFEVATGKQIHELFDVVSGVSTGAILSLLLGGLHCPLHKCESLYRQMSWEIFKPSTWWGTGRLVWSHAYYDTNAWSNMLKSVYKESLMIETMRKKNNPKIAVISAVMNQPALQAFVFRNYNLPYRVKSHYSGACKYKMWQAVRASGAAPGYFEEYELDGNVHQDGGLLINNPTAVAIHEAKLMWPNERIQCVVSIGSGRYIPPSSPAPTSTSLKTKILKVIDSATDTEAVHTVLQDLLPTCAYYRINPYLSERVTLDETRAEKLDQMILDAQLYLRRNDEKFNAAVKALTARRNIFQSIEDWAKLQVAIKW